MRVHRFLAASMPIERLPMPSGKVMMARRSSWLLPRRRSRMVRSQLEASVLRCMSLLLTDCVAKPFRSGRANFLIAAEALGVSGCGGPPQPRPVVLTKTGDESTFARILLRRYFRVLQHNRPFGDIGQPPTQSNSALPKRRFGSIRCHLELRGLYGAAFDRRQREQGEESE